MGSRMFVLDSISRFWCAVRCYAITIMASLMQVPVELLGLICSDLGTGDILSLCRSCKSLYSAAHPLLFRHITIAWDRSARPDEPPNFTSLLLFILKYPSYARYIKTVNIPRVKYGACHDYAWRLSRKGTPPPLSNPEETALVRDVIEELYLPELDYEEWYISVAEEPNLGATITLILALCTHLESLTVDVHFLPPSNFWFPDMIKSAVSLPKGATRLSRFQKLTRLTVSSLNIPDHDLPTETFLLCFYLPSVTTLCFADALNDPEREPWDPTSASHRGPVWPLARPPLAASLTTLHLNDTRARPGAVEFLLRHTPNLQSLVYVCSLPSSSSPLDLVALRQGLEHVRDTLTHLSIRFDIFADEGLDPRNLAAVLRGSLGPLGSMTALEDINVPLALLLGQVTPQTAAPLADVLPSRLKRLTINDDLWNYDAFNTWEPEHVGSLLTAFFAGPCKTATPRLEDFVLDMWENSWVSYECWDDEDKKEALQELTESQGIRCEISR
ncbi:hypothetical protein INS49_009129 [Diaporthe citri]|uniref:uncharacterized protein n=1 Tax=Diaporthe citri TaxID=83186 RepID=UPI001C7FEC16|nr:uncharacterized protein INS49_009129 [Diaporthe citri]KAG6364026.1 hypothetical protein INS49_009129 [Diaporthe citri]